MTQAQPSVPASLRYRLWFLALVFAAAMGGLLIKSWILQVVELGKHQKNVPLLMAKEQKKRMPRGRIFARKGLTPSAEPVLLADSELVYSVETNIDKLPKALLTESALKDLADALQAPLPELKRVLQATGVHGTLKLNSTQLARKEAADRVSEVLEKHKLSEWIGVHPVPIRRYPQGALAFDIIGRVTHDQKGLLGLEGLEAQFDKELRGPTEADVDGDLRLLTPGNDLYLTLHDTMQAELERIVAEEVENLRERFGQIQGTVLPENAVTGSVVALDPQTGAVLAMASIPTKTYVNGTLVARNRAVTDRPEPGSTIKPFVIAATLDGGGTVPHEEWDCEKDGVWHPEGWPAGALIHDAESHGKLTTTQVIARSSNICAAKIAMKRLGREKLYNVLRRAGFGERTSTEFIGEAPGTLEVPAKWDPLRFATIAFGQGMAATNLQVAAATAALSNKGIWHRPHIVQFIKSPDGKVVYEAHPEERPVVRADSAESTFRMMRAALGPHGTAHGQDLPGYPMACKTGTAQLVNPNGGKGYDGLHWHASEVCAAPYPNPRLLLSVSVTLDFSSYYPHGLPAHTKAPDHSGAHNAGPFIVKAMPRLLTIRNVPPEPESALPRGQP